MQRFVFLIYFYFWSQFTLFENLEKNLGKINISNIYDSEQKVPFRSSKMSRDESCRVGLCRVVSGCVVSCWVRTGCVGSCQDEPIQDSVHQIHPSLFDFIQVKKVKFLLMFVYINNLTLWAVSKVAYFCILSLSNNINFSCFFFYKIL